MNAPDPRGLGGLVAPSADLEAVLAAADAAIARRRVEVVPEVVRVGVDLGTAYLVMFVLDADGQPLVGASRPATVVRDGVVVDLIGAAGIVRELKADLEQRLGRELTSAATCYPPGVPVADVRATRYVLEAAELECSALVDEPTAANAVLKVRDGAVVDVGGGTTGIAVLADGEVIDTADEPTGGTHVTLVLAGAHGVSIEAAEAMKLDPAQQRRLLPVVRPVFEKVATIVARHVADHDVGTIHLVGGTASFPGIAEILRTETGIPTVVPSRPLFVTPLGVALHDRRAAPIDVDTPEEAHRG